MKRSCLMIFALLLGGLCGLLTANAQADDANSKLIHNVFFTLNDSTPENRAKLVAACHTLSDIPDIDVFRVGTLSEDLESPVNVRDFDVSLTVIFANKKAHDVYQTHDVHVKFVKENRPSFKKVQVFDTYEK